MDGTIAQPVNATFKSPVGDSYSFRVGIFSDPSASCDADGPAPDKWWPEEDYKDAFSHTSNNNYYANFNSETMVVELYCHNYVEDCNLEMSLTIGKGAVGVGTMGTSKSDNLSRAE